jgi:hypothetical protein
VIGVFVCFLVVLRSTFLGLMVFLEHWEGKENNDGLHNNIGHIKRTKQKATTTKTTTTTTTRWLEYCGLMRLDVFVVSLLFHI